ncbi:hypothetical protein G7Y89_g10632 [Cudoniella acicularis]|uniref:Uncharacterized protein n=1 Tax=Cudoniella acicularis TaxID=354080 RepID=A0A8H4RG19_9HELO|nr:hypothetical protein G7Y89_g10632 [Cudoniella acicularis]
MFRNESETVIGKVKAREKTKAKTKSDPKTPFASTSPFSSSSSSSSFSSPWDLPPDGYDDIDEKILKEDLAEFSLNYPNTLMGGFAVDLVPSVSYSLSPTLQERARGYFYANSATWLRDFDLLNILCTQTSQDEYLLASISAVGLATLSSAFHVPGMAVQARRDYVTALRLTNAALKSPANVKKDSTLFTVLILSIFETMTGSDAKSLTAWTKHVDGASALIQLRGVEQFRSTAGQRMFLQIMSSVILSCVQRSIYMPVEFLELRKHAAKHMDAFKPAWKLSGIIIDFTSLRAAVRNLQIVGPRNIVDAALDLDRRFIEVAAEFLPEYGYETVYTDENPDLVWKGFYHQYQNHWTAQIWNAMRTCRILLHEAIRDQQLIGSNALVPIFTEAEIATQTESSNAIMLQLQADILASVPQHISDGSGLPNRSFLEGSRGYFILWPLYLVCAMDLVTEEIRQWAIARLRSLAAMAGIGQANVLADHLEKRIEFTDWNTKPAPNHNIMKGLVEGTIENIFLDVP